MTTKPTNTVNASANDLLTFENATIIGFNLEYKENKPSVTVRFRSRNNKLFTAIAHPAIFWKDKIGVESTIVVYTGADKWKLYSPRPTAKELEAFEKAQEQRKPDYTEHKANAKQLAFLASF